MDRLRKWLDKQGWVVLREERMGNKDKITALAPSGTMWAIWGRDETITGWQAVY